MNQAGEVDAQERELRVRHRVDQVADQVLALGPDPVVLAAKRHDSHFTLFAREQAHPVAVQPRAVDHEIAGLVSRSGVYSPLPLLECKRRHPISPCMASQTFS